MEEDIKVFKLVTGEELMSRVTDEDDDSFTLSKPRVVAIGPGPNNQVSVTLIPLFASSQNGIIRLNKSSIVATPVEFSPELEKAYIEQTTGIALA